MSQASVVLTTDQVQHLLPVGDTKALLDERFGKASPAAIRANEAVFAEQAANDNEQHLVAGLVGMWTGTLLLHDLAREHLDPPANKEEEKAKKKDEPE
jgi:hypothetical protein